MIIFGFLLCLLFGVVLRLLLPMLEIAYVYVFKKPIYVHFYWRLKKLPENQALFLQENVLFYRKLNRKQKQFFQHRLCLFMNEKEFEGRDGFKITTEVKILVSATAIMLTFGMRKFLMPRLQTILIYPTVYYSLVNQTYHKGEFNPGLKILVFSWEDFKKGYAIENDNLNLGIHEFIHVLQFNSIKATDVSATIFADTNVELESLLTHSRIRNKVQTSRYFRNYAFTNRFEFLAVVVECFIESPKELRQEFPMIYDKVKTMLNFNFDGYN